MTELLQFAQEIFKKRGKGGNVGYCLVGEHVVTMATAYCFGSMGTHGEETLEGKLQRLKECEEDEDMNVVDRWGSIPLVEEYHFMAPGMYRYMILRGTNKSEGAYREPEDEKGLAQYLRCQELLLSSFEYALVPATFEERRANGIIIDLDKITSNALGVLLVGHRNMYEKKRYETIIPLMDDHGWGFEEAFTISQFFKRYESPHNGVLWVGDNGGHCIINGNVSYNHDKQLVALLQNNLFFTFTGDSYYKTHKWWGVGAAYVDMLKEASLYNISGKPEGLRHGYRPKTTVGTGFNAVECVFQGTYPNEIAQLKGIMKESKQ